jgi:hypothetical protein
VAPGALPTGWTAAHGAGLNTVPWRTSNSFATALCGTSNQAFHANANDGPAGGDQARWERLFSPIVTVPSNAQYSTVEFDVCYDTENDPVLPGLGYDGFFLRITDQTAGRTLRSVLAEAFAQEFTTDGFQHYPKHFPRNDDFNYFEDMSAWSDFPMGSNTFACGCRARQAAVSNRSTRTGPGRHLFGRASRPRLWRLRGQCAHSQRRVGVRLLYRFADDVQSVSRDPATNEVVASLTVTNAGTGTSTNVQLTSVLLNSTPTTTALPNLGSIAPGGAVNTSVRFPGAGFTAGTAAVLRVAGSYTGGNFSASSRVTIP